MSQQQKLREEITSEIVAAIEAGTLPWRRPWRISGNAGSPTNALTKRAYRGVNPLVLNLAAMKKGFQSRFWATFNQWRSLGSTVKRGEHGTRIVFSVPMTRTARNRSGEDVEETFWMLRSFVVFNAEQCKESRRFLIADALPSPKDDDARFERAFEVVGATHADIRHGGDSAHYSIAGDFIQMPHQTTFSEGLPAYFDTLFHELAHWTEFHDRTDWKKTPHGEIYAAGELRAELASAYLCDELGLRTPSLNENTAAYLNDWLQKLREDSSFIFKMATAASKASDFILSFSQEVEASTDTTYESVPC